MRTRIVLGKRWKRQTLAPLHCSPLFSPENSNMALGLKSSKIYINFYLNYIIINTFFYNIYKNIGSNIICIIRGYTVRSAPHSIKTGMAGMNSIHRRYEVRTRRGKCWHVDSRNTDKGNALASANSLAANRSLEGVIVVEEFFDKSLGRYQERTIFSYFPQEYEKFCRSVAEASSYKKPPPRRLLPRPPSAGGPAPDDSPWATVM